MDTGLFEQLHAEGQIDDAELAEIKLKSNGPVSVHWDLRTLLYLGILLLTSGLGIFIYKNLDAIGHVTIVAAVGILCVASFVYCFKHAAPYSNHEVESPNLWFDYVLLMGCLLLLTFIGYLQYQFHVFGTQWGLATFVPMLALFYCAYYFDNKGIQAMAVTNLAAWMGIAVQPKSVQFTEQFANDTTLWSAIALGVVLHIFSYVSVGMNIKAHFAFIYKNFGIHLLFVALLAAMFRYEHFYFLWFLVVAAVAAFHLWDAKREQVFYFFAVAALYGYIALSTVVVHLLFFADRTGGSSEAMVYLALLYFIASAIVLITFLIGYNKTFGQNDSI